jgi:outer membrane protein
MRTPFIKTLLFIIILMHTTAWSQNVLEEYIQEGLKNNLVLQQKSITLDKALLSLKIANGMFMPAVTLQGNYTHGDGGRNIPFPVGDLLNPVYGTLNQLTDSERFPQIENVNVNFFPKNFYDTRVRTSVPIFNTDLYQNRKIQQHQVMLHDYEAEIYKRELVRAIKTAYFQYLSAIEAMRIYTSALQRAEESKRVNEALLKNGSGLPAYLLRAESEIQTIKSQLTEAEKQVQNAQLYFNFLLNRDGNMPVSTFFKPEEAVANLNRPMDVSWAPREELKQLQAVIEVQEAVHKMNRLNWTPKVNGFLDVGSQYENWVFNRQSRYYLVGLQVDIPLFAGFTNRNRVYQSALDIRHTQLSYSLLQQQLGMASRVALHAVESAFESYAAAQQQLQAATSYDKLIDKGYKAGINTYIETVDARNQLTAAQLQVTLTQYKLLIAQATYERETAQYPVH